MKKVIIQAFKFFGISGIGWLMDMVIYSTLTYFGLHIIIANIISSFCAVTFVYLTSTKKLFINNNNVLNVKKKYILYIIYQVIIILASSYVIGLISNLLLKTNITLIIKYYKIIGKIIITPFTMIINFIFMKFLIEKV
jgi:hypothetical protein